MHWDGACALPVEVPGAALHAEWLGPVDAPWVLCLHSLGTDAGLWAGAVGALASDFRVLGLDLRGHGLSTVSAPPYTVDLLAADALGALDAAGAGAVDVVGISLGGAVSMALAVEPAWRAWVRSLVVADARADSPAEYVQLWEHNIALAERDGVGPVVQQAMARWFSPEFLARRPSELEALERRARLTPADGLVGGARALQHLDLLPRLGDIEVPALFVVGEQDTATTPELMADMAARVPGARLVAIPGAGHLSVVEAPERFGAVVHRFLGRKGEP